MNLTCFIFIILLLLVVVTSQGLGVRDSVVGCPSYPVAHTHLLAPSLDFIALVWLDCTLKVFGHLDLYGLSLRAIGPHLSKVKVITIIYDERYGSHSKVHLWSLKW